MLTRRSVLGAAGAGLALAGSGWPRLSASRAAGAPVTPGRAGGNCRCRHHGDAAGKKPLIRLAYRPPNYKSPLDYFRTPITPNDEFFIRYHLSDIPDVDAATYKIAVGGDGANGQTELTLDDLAKLPAYEIVAVNQCSGNRRGLSNPHVAGVEWGYGAMGCARWQGPGSRMSSPSSVSSRMRSRLRSTAPMARPSTRRRISSRAFRCGGRSIKSTLIAYEMNGAPLPHLNGFPGAPDRAGLDRHLWMKHLISLTR